MYQHVWSIAVAYFANYSVDYYFATPRVSGFINTFNMSTNSSVCDGNIITVILYHTAMYVYRSGRYLRNAILCCFN